MPDRLAKSLSLLLTAAGAVGALWLGARFVLPWTAPFLAAWVMAALLERPVAFLCRRGWRRGAAAGLCTVLALGLLLWALVLLTWKGVDALTEFVRLLPALMESLQQRLAVWQRALETRIQTAPAGSAVFFEQGLSAFNAALSALPGEVSRAALGFLSRTAQASPDTALFFVTAALGTYFLSASFPTVRAFLRAQVILLLMTFFQLTAAFLLLRLPGAVGLAALTALIDALPVFGTGLVLLPWGLACLLLGLTRRGLGLLVSWGVTALVRRPSSWGIRSVWIPWLPC